jgi:hypothetical protein
MKIKFPVIIAMSLVLFGCANYNEPLNVKNAAIVQTSTEWNNSKNHGYASIGSIDQQITDNVQTPYLHVTPGSHRFVIMTQARGSHWTDMSPLKAGVFTANVLPNHRYHLTATVHPQVVISSVTVYMVDQNGQIVGQTGEI